ncbi:HAD family hydrolase [Natrarchaeobaculum aegyptiacum]|uniref:HAD family hydrolase n=1 Tax=Natrarchaeobaculum aegyptiacum TaxID=745377 RepID=A0A2Z2HUZ8_9EURY|nr:HAD family hydrolase [Natrarchaeobaculum aegyptiacum]ARS88854.1 HAD family hydrolase [Natrarchaeobaculum aegyptiacum]
MGVSFDLFGTLVAAERPATPATAVGAELEARGVTVPDDWQDAYGELHHDLPPGRELSLVDHVAGALESRGVVADHEVSRAAVIAAFDASVEVRPGARAAVATARERGPVAVCSNCSVPGLVERTLEQTGLEAAGFDAVVSSVDCGWRKPAPEIFAVTAERLGVSVADLVHVGDDPQADGGIEDVGGTALVLATADGGPGNRTSTGRSERDTVTLEAVPDRLERVVEGQT